MITFQPVTILCMLMCLLEESVGSNEGMFFNSWPYNTGKKATKEKSDDGQDAPNSWLFGSDSSQQNVQPQQASAPAPASNMNTGGFQFQKVGGGQNTNFQMKTVNNNQWGVGQNSQGFNNNHRQQQQQGGGYNIQHGQQVYSGNRNTQQNQNQRGGGGSQFGFGNSNNNYNSYNNFQGHGFQATTSTTTATTTTTTTTPKPAKANQNDGMFFNSWPYNTNSNKKKTQDDWKAKKNEPNPFLFEAPKEYPPERKPERNSNSQNNFGFNNRNQLANDFKTPQTQQQNVPHNSFQHPFVWPEVSKTTPSTTTTTTTTVKPYNVKNKWQYEEEAQEERQRQNQNAILSDDNVNQWSPPSQKLNSELESYLQNLANSMREKIENSELEKAQSKIDDVKLDKGDRNFRFREPEDLNSASKQSALISEKEGTMFEDPPTTIQEDKYWYLPQSMREFIGIESKSRSSHLQTPNCILHVSLLIVVTCTLWL